MNEVGYISLLFALFVMPRVLLRFRIPTAITSLGLGFAAALGFGQLAGDATLGLLSTFGIVALFLFAGLDVDLEDLRRQARVLLQHVVLQAACLALVAVAVAAWLGLQARPASLVALALLTPSTGFILDSLGSLGLSEHERFWIRSKAIASELVALAILFATVQSESPSGLLVSLLVLSAIIVVLPLLFRLFAAFIVPHAPGSEFAFLMMMAVATGAATYHLGVYYLVGAFIVGMAAQLLRHRLPAIASERMLHSVEAFASLFVPFYFFGAGLHTSTRDFGPRALLIGLVFVVVGVSFRVVVLWLHRRWALGESFRASLQVSVPMLPTLVFTLVVAAILRERYAIDPALFGGLVLYTLVTSLVPGWLLGRTLPNEEDELRVEDTQPPLA